MRVPGDVRGSDKDPSKNVKKHWKKSPVKTFEETEDLEDWWDKDWPKTEADLQVKVLKLTETLIIKGRNNQVESGVKYEFNEVTGKIEITLPETEEFAFDGKKIEATLKGGVLSGIKGIKRVTFEKAAQDWFKAPQHRWADSNRDLPNNSTQRNIGLYCGAFFFARRLLQLDILVLWSVDSFGVFLVDFWAACHTYGPSIPR